MMPPASRCLGAAILLATLGLGVGLGASPSFAHGDELRVYPTPQALMYTAHNDDFTVRVRQPGGPWNDLFEYRIRVDWDAPQNASLVYFDFSGAVEVQVQKNNGHAAQASVSPRSSTIKPQQDGAILRFTLTKPESFSIQFDDDRLHNLHIVAGALPAPAPTGPHVRVFAPGLHQPPAGSTSFPVQSGETIYLAGGAVLRGAFDLTQVHDVTIMGRGLLWDPGRGIDLNGADTIHISDLILANTEREAGARVLNIRNSSHVFVDDITGFTAGKWSDGINISTSQHVRVNDSYLRTSDDGVVVYAVTDCPTCGDKPIAPVGPPGSRQPADTFDIRVSNMRLWNDVAHAMFVGHFGDNGAPRHIHDVSFDSIDVANLDEDEQVWEGAMAIYSGDSTRISNISFSNIRVDRIEEGKLINIVAGNNARYNKSPGRGIDGVTLRNIHFSGEGLPGPSVIAGLSPGTAVRNVSIENLTISGQSATTPASANIEVGPFVDHLSITK